MGLDVIEVDTQITFRNFDPSKSVGNIAFLIKGEQSGEVSSAVQISSHYDSVGISPGASDSGASCAVMLELASVLVSREQKLQYDILLLFVDSEENGLVGSSNWIFGNNNSLDASFHVDPHPWSLLPALVINLEGSGIANGKEILARANSGKATKFYASYVRYPMALSLTEFLFRTVDAGTTDTEKYFLAGLHCMDLIFIQDQWVYHSPSDNVNNVRPEA